METVTTIERDCMRCEETFATTNQENADYCPKCRRPDPVVATRSPEERRQIAMTILDQLGGRMFLRMTGAKNLTHNDGDLSFMLPIGKAGGCRVALTPMDTYTVTFYKREHLRTIVKNQGRTALSTHEDVYAENLRDLFEQHTGLQTRFPKVRGL